MDRRVISNDQLQCPRCGGTTVETRIERDTFPYGSGESAVELNALVPVRICTACGFEYMDGAAEDARHEAVCHHLGILTPRQIVSIRKFHGYNRAAFASLTRFGEASLARWESGAMTQNAANDQLLFLLHFPDNIARLQERAAGKSIEHPTNVAKQQRRFIALEDVAEKRQEAQGFQLHRQAPA